MPAAPSGPGSRSGRSSATLDEASPTPGTSSDRRSAVKRATILDAAAAVFLEHGYGRTSVDAIAAEAGSGKQTVYNHFGDKERLFLAVLDHVRDLAWSQTGRLAMPDTGDPRADLAAFAEHELDFVLAPQMAALHRLTIAELPHHPELQRMWREGSQEPAIDDECVAYLRACHHRGTLCVPDPVLATHQFSVLVISEGRIATLQGTQTLPADQRRRIAEQASDLVVRAHHVVT